MKYAKTSIMGTSGYIKGWAVIRMDERLYVWISVHKTIPTQKSKFPISGPDISKIEIFR